MSDPSRDPSVFDEPHMRGGGFHADPREEKVARNLEATSGLASEDESVEITVWDEPGLSTELAGTVPATEITYGRWLDKRRSETAPAATWVVTCAVALMAGPWAVLGAIWGGGQTVSSIFAIVVFGPVVEEMMKAGAALYVVEKRPFLFRSPMQIVLCVLAGAFMFAAIENSLYLNVYIAHPPPGLVRWRWTVCVAMHMGCSLIVSLGLMRIWTDVWKRRARPRIPLGFPYIVTAVVVHGTYNALALLLHFADFQF